MRLPIIILGYSEAAMLLRGPHGPSIKAIITIFGDREYPLDAPDVSHRLELHFDDCEAPGGGDLLQAARVHLHMREAAEAGLWLTPPTHEHAQAIIEFARTIQPLDGTLLCQCRAGISRSPAAALLCLAAWSAPGEEDECVRRLLAIRSCAIPHPDLVAFGDDVLNRDGRLIAALQQAQVL